VNNKSLSSDYVKRAKIRLSAVETLLHHKGFADVVRESQEIVELACKGLLRHFGIEPARVHDVSVQLNELQELVSNPNNIAVLIKISKSLRRDRELAFYGSEDLTPSEFYNESDAKEAFQSAQEVVRVVLGIIKG